MIITPNETTEVYHASGAIGSSRAKLAFKSLRLFKDDMDGLTNRADKPHFAIGRIAHMMILEPDRFLQQVVAEGPINPKTGKPYGRDSLAFQDWQDANPGSIVVEPWLLLMLARMPDPIREHLAAGGMAEQSVRVDYSPHMKIQCRPDYWLGDQIDDIKTIDDVDNIRREIKARMYWLSESWYKLTVKASTGKDCRFRFIFCEKKPPYRWRSVYLASTYQEAAAYEVKALADRLSLAFENNEWDDPYPGDQIEDMPSFLFSDEMTINSEGGLDL